MTDHGHARCVAAWLERAPRDLPPEQRLAAFERAFDAVFRRAGMTLGEVTLTAIGNRVLHDAGERFPLLSSLQIDAGGLRWQALRARAAGAHGEEMREAARFVLVEFLTVLGNLTAEILTPALHAELSSVTGEGAGGRASPDERAASEDDEGAAP